MSLKLKLNWGSQVPIYDFKLSKRVGFRTQAVPKSRVVIIEGIYSLSTRLRYIGRFCACGCTAEGWTSGVQKVTLTDVTLSNAFW